MALQVPARMDVRIINGKTVIMDGAHNGQKMEAFLRSYKHRYTGQKAAVLLSLKSNKDYQEVLPQLVGVADTLLLTTFSFSQDRPLHGIDPEELAQFAKNYDFKQIVAEPDQAKAYKLLLNQSEEMLIITGSFYLIGQLRSAHKELQNA